MDNSNLILLLFVVLCLNSCLTQHIDKEYQIQEESSSPQIFGNIVRDTSLSTEYTQTQLDKFTYSFLANGLNNISINPVNGDLSIVGRIDREAICPGAVNCTRQFDISIAENRVQKALKRVSIIIGDINDNVPTFRPNIYKLEIPESANVNRSFTGLPTAVDEDSPVNSIKSYSLSGKSDWFRLQTIQTAPNLYSLRLVLLKSLDRETKDRHILLINASDGSPKQGSLTVEVVVKDSNDHSPVFNNSNYRASIKENIPVGTTVLHVYAKDLDTGANGEVVYKFQAPTQQLYGQLFGINNKTGAIFTKGVIDYEQESTYHLGVIAHDLGSDSIPVDTKVTVTVIDQNDRGPEITVNTLTRSNTDVAEIPEDAAVGTFVAQLRVKDADSGDNGKVTCTLNDNVFTLEEVTAFEEYRIITASDLDRETNPVYNLAILCRDGGIQPQQAIKQLKVDVLDVNDHPPQFLKPGYFSEIFENNTAGTSITTVSARDDDIGLNAKITYSLSAEAVNQFQINPSNGTITALVSLDRETAETMEFHVIAFDNGINTQLNNSVLVTVKLKDINDEAPRFDQPVYNFHITEESLPSISVGRVYAEDRDAPPENAVSYSIDSAAQAYFSINANTGEVMSLRSFDREHQAVYTIIVTATDSGRSMQRQSTTQVNVVLDDINDNKPMFTFPAQNNHTIQISNRLQIGQKIGTVMATDLDTGTFGHVTYKLVESTEAEDFSVDALSGDITLVRDLTLIELKEYNLVISASDQGTPPHTVFANLKVVVNKSVSLPGEPSAILSKPNETAVIAVACVAALLIVPLAIGIVCICYHRNRLNNHKQHKLWKTLHFWTLTTEKSEAVDVTKQQHPVVCTVTDTGHMIHSDKKLVQRSTSSQDSGIENPLNMSWHSLNASHLQDDKDSSSAADSGRGASEADDNSHSHIVHQAPSGGGRPDRPPKAVHVGAQFDSPSRRLLYKDSHKAQLTSQPHRQYSQSRDDLHRSDSYPDRSVQYIDGRCSKDVYV